MKNYLKYESRIKQIYSYNDYNQQQKILRMCVCIYACIYTYVTMYLSIWYSYDILMCYILQ